MSIASDLREIAALSGPAALTLLAEPAAAMFEAAVVGRALGTDALGALAVGQAVVGLCLRLCNFLAYATTPLVAEARAERRGPAAAAATAAAARCARRSRPRFGSRS